MSLIEYVLMTIIEECLKTGYSQAWLPEMILVWFLLFFGCFVSSCLAGHFKAEVNFGMIMGKLPSGDDKNLSTWHSSSEVGEKWVII